MNSASVVNPLLLGGLLGLIGQSIRVIVGLKKTYDYSQQQNTTFKQTFDGTQLLVSLLIGFVAGCLGTLVQLNFKDDFVWTKDLAVEMIAVGYAGADFIEGVMKKFLPSSNNDPNNPNPNPGPNPTPNGNKSNSTDANGSDSAGAGSSVSTGNAPNSGAATAVSTQTSTEDIAG